jgi:putative endonuclease
MKDNQFYVGYTNDLRNRFDTHLKGNVESTKKRRPLKLVYYEACLNKNDALKREKYLKTTWGKKVMAERNIKQISLNFLFMHMLRVMKPFST